MNVTQPHIWHGGTFDGCENKRNLPHAPQAKHGQHDSSHSLIKELSSTRWGIRNCSSPISFSKTTMLLTMRPDETFNDPENNERNVRMARKLKMECDNRYRLIIIELFSTAWRVRTLLQGWNNTINHQLCYVKPLLTMRQDVCAHCWSWTTLYLHALSHLLRSRFHAEL